VNWYKIAVETSSKWKQSTIMATDGDFNVGQSSTSYGRFSEKKRNVNQVFYRC
jgi:hypothetical protein